MIKLFAIGCTVFLLASCSKDEPLYMEQPKVNLAQKDTLTNLSLYPNPFSSTLNCVFNLSESDSINYMLFDLTGRTLINKNILALKNTNQFTLHLDTLNDGVYIIRVEAFNRSYIRKVIKAN